MATKMNWYPVPGGNCPKVEELQTGDLLFPRKPGLSGQAFGWGTYWVALLEKNPDVVHERFNVKIGDLLKTREAVELALWSVGQEGEESSRRTKYSPDPTRLSPRRHSAAGGLQYWHEAIDKGPDSYSSLLLDPDSPQHPLSQTGLQTESGSFPGPDDPDFLLAMQAILNIAFPDLLEGWLGMTVAEFVKSDLRQFLIDALTSPDVRLSFFVGHVGIVLREQDGQSVKAGGSVYVIEANITDFSHYRVSIHPYSDGSDVHPDNETEADVAKLEAHKMYGWVNRRCALGEYVWHAKPYEPLIADWQNRLLQASKKHLGRPYGFFDHPTFGDDDRMYCSEFVYRAFRDVDAVYAERLQDKQTWGSMRTYLDKSGQKVQSRLVESIQTKQGIANDQPFFVMPPALLWNSTALERLPNPSYAVAEPYAPSI